MRHMRRSSRGVLVVLAMLAVMLGVLAAVPATAMAKTATYSNLIPTGEQGESLEEKQVSFNGYKWYIIADNSESNTKGTVTLFAADVFKTEDNESITSKFHDNSSNDYSTSMVKSVLDEMIGERGPFADVTDAICAVDLGDVNVTKAKLYLLSKNDADTMVPRRVRRATISWWLRSPEEEDVSKAAYVAGESGSIYGGGTSVGSELGIRPALQLDLSRVAFNTSTT